MAIRNRASSRSLPALLPQEHQPRKGENDVKYENDVRSTRYS
jgi:hypothetical protein